MSPTNEPTRAVVGYAPVPVAAVPPFRIMIMRYGIGAAICMVSSVVAFWIPLIGNRRAFIGHTDDLIEWLSAIMRHTEPSALVYFGLFAFCIGCVRGFPLGTTGPLMVLPYLVTCGVELVRGTGSNLLPIQLFQLLILAIGGSIFAVFGHLGRCAMARIVSRRSIST